jgi:hypothetical protein
MAPPEAHLALVRQTHNESQSDIDSRNVFVVEMADLSANSRTPNCHGLISHNLRSHPQPVPF